MKSRDRTSSQRTRRHQDVESDSPRPTRSPKGLLKQPVLIDLEESNRRRLPVAMLHGITIHAITEQQCVEHIIEELEADRGGWVVTHNLDHVRRLQKDAPFAALCASRRDW